MSLESGKTNLCVAVSLEFGALKKPSLFWIVANNSSLEMRKETRSIGLFGCTAN